MNERVKFFIKSKRFTTARFAKLLDIPKYTIDKYLSGKTAYSQRFIEAFLMAFPDVSPDWLIKGEGTMLKAGATQETATSESPYFEELKIQGGSISDTCDEMFMPRNMAGRIMIPGLPMGDDIPYIRVRSNSMLDRKNTALSIPARSIIGIRKCQSSVIKWGEVYAFMTADDLIVKKLLPSDDSNHVRCVSFNEEDGYYPFDLTKSEIIGPLFDVVAVVNIQTR